jgi:biopolymer transport protein ExbD
MAKPKHRMGVKLDMTPMVDVAFLLLIFFMSTTQFKPPEQVSVNLPECTSEFQVPMSGIIVLTVTKDGTVYIGNETGQAALVPPGGEMDAIVQERSKRPGALIIVKGDKDADFGTVSDLIDSLQRTRTLRFNLMTELERTDRKKPTSAPTDDAKGG